MLILLPSQTRLLQSSGVIQWNGFEVVDVSGDRGCWDMPATRAEVGIGMLKKLRCATNDVPELVEQA